MNYETAALGEGRAKTNPNKVTKWKAQNFSRTLWQGGEDVVEGEIGEKLIII